MSAKGSGIRGSPRKGTPAEPIVSPETPGKGGGISGSPTSGKAKGVPGQKNTGKKQPPPYTAPNPPEISGKKRVISV